MEKLIVQIGLVASCILPLFNIPLIAHMIQRKSSADLSMTWAIGVWACIVLMFPAALRSTDIIFRIFGITNLALFSLVVFFAIKYRIPPKKN